MLTNRKQDIQLNTISRVRYLDYLRVFATLAVMIIHISGQHFYDTDVRGIAWQSFNIYDSLFRWGVPVFAMISGALFLSRDIPIRRIYTKYVLRMAVAFLFWCFVYYLCGGQGIKEQFLGLFSDGKTYRYIEILDCPYHLWFVLTISGIYICLPIIKKIVEDMKVTRYFLVIAFIFVSVLPLISVIVRDFGGMRLGALQSVIDSDISSMNMHLVSGYVCYFILGYCLSTIDISKKHRIWIYISGILGAVFTIVMNAIVARMTGEFCGNYYGYFYVNVLAESVAVFILFKYMIQGAGKDKADVSLDDSEGKKPGLLDRVIQKLSGYSFGAYLVHLLIIYKLDSHYKLDTLTFHPVASVIVITGIVFVVSFAISFVLNQIPLVKRYIV